MHYPIQELEFLSDGVENLVNGHEVLKFSYCYRYYMQDKMKIHLFDHHLDLLQEAIDKLHGMIEQPLDPFLDESDPDRSPFAKFRSSLINISAIAQSNYQKFIEEIE